MPFPIRRDQRAADRCVAPPTIPAAPKAGQRGALFRDDAEPEDANQGLRCPRGASELIERAQLSPSVLRARHVGDGRGYGRARRRGRVRGRGS
tara:strand:- start:171 stop:449 length:279 start_codon:yes stop_codon:yes gene_type:complete